MADTDLTSLEQQIMRDYGKYISVPIPTVAPTKQTLNLAQHPLLRGQTRVQPYAVPTTLPYNVARAGDTIQLNANSDLFKKYLPLLTAENSNINAHQILNELQPPSPPLSGIDYLRTRNNTQPLLNMLGKRATQPIKVNFRPTVQTNTLEQAMQMYADRNKIKLEDLQRQIEATRAAKQQLIANTPQSIDDINRTMYAQPTAQQMPGALPQQVQAQYAQPGQNYAHGGSVKTHYADGDLVEVPDPYYDAANPDFASQVRANMDANPLYAGEAPAPVAVAEPSASERAAIERRNILNSLQTALAAPVSSNKGMSEQERNFRLAAAFAKPTKFGSFSESLGNAAESLADIAAVKRAEQKDIAAQELARLQARMGVAQQQYEMSREEEMRNMLKSYITKGNRTLSEAAGGAANEFGVPEDVAQLILSQPTEKAVGTLIELAKENNKPSDLIRGVKFLVKSGSITQEEGANIVKQNLTPKFEVMDVNVPELGGTVQMSSEEARKYTNEGVLPARITGEKPVSTTAAPAAKPAAPVKPAKTREQLAAEQEGLKEQAKKDIEQGDTLLSQKSFADQQIQAAKEISALARTNPKAFGLIADPTVANSLLSIIDKGVSTPFGNVGVAVEEPLAKFKLSGPDAKARQIGVRPITLIEVGYRKLFLKGEGAVSNMEGELAKYIGPQLSDKAEVIQLKAGAVQIAAEKQKAIVEGFEKYKEKNPAAGPRSFYQTPAYKNIVNTYEKRYYDFAKSNGLDISPPSASKGGSSLVERIRRNRERLDGAKNGQ